MLVAVTLAVGTTCLLGSVPGRATTPSTDPGTVGPRRVTTADYDFGDSAFTPLGFPAPVEVRARVYYPQALTGTFPLVIFLHGRHVTCYDPATGSPFFEWPCEAGRQPIPSHLGYAAQAKLLASHGYIVASISANSINYNDDATADLGANARGQLVLHHLDLWRSWARGNAEPFGNLFTGHVDMSAIGLMGHSRGGEGVAAAAVFNRLLGSPYGIRAVITLAPTDFSRLVPTRVPLEVVLPYCDGDVSDLQGIHFYDDARDADPNDSTPKHAVLVSGADHNFFNSVWTPPFPGGGDDWFGPEEPFCDRASPTSGRLSPSGQRKVGANLFAAFFRRYLGGESGLDPYLDGSLTRPPSLQRVTHSDLSVSYHAGTAQTTRRDVARFLGPGSLFVDALGGRVTFSGFDDVSLCGATSPHPFCLYDFDSGREPHSTSSFLAPNALGLSQLRLTWSRPGALALFRIPAAKGDVRAYRAVTLRAGVVFTNPLNAPGNNQDLLVRLEDAAGHVAYAPVSQFSPALRYPPGSPDSFSPVPKLYDATIRIPLRAFAGVDLRAIRSLGLVSFQTASGSITATDLAFTDPA